MSTAVRYHLTIVPHFESLLHGIGQSISSGFLSSDESWRVRQTLLSLSRRPPQILMSIQSEMTKLCDHCSWLCQGLYAIPSTATIVDNLWYQQCAYPWDQCWYYGVQSRRSGRWCCSDCPSQWRLRYRWGRRLAELGQRSSNVQAAEAEMKESMKSNFWNYMQTIFDQIKQSISAYKLNFEGDMSSLGTVLTQNIWGMCSRITERLDGVPRDVSNSGKGLSS